MNVNELRIGNQLELRGEVVIIAGITKPVQEGEYSIIYWRSSVGFGTFSDKISLFKGLEITEEYLSKLGLINRPHDPTMWTFDVKGQPPAIFAFPIGTLFCGQSVVEHIKYVHQFQNVYFWMVGHELSAT